MGMTGKKRPNPLEKKIKNTLPLNFLTKLVVCEKVELKDKVITYATRKNTENYLR